MAAQEARRKKRSFFHTKKWAVLLSILILIGLQWLEFQGWLPLLNGRILDAILRHHASQSDTAASAEIYVIGIDDDAYSTIFDNRSPMDPNGVSALVEAVADANPKVIGVDIRTEGMEYRNQIKAFKKIPSSIVWISSFKPVETYVAPFSSWLFGAQDRFTVAPFAVLGMSPFELPKLRQTNWGIPLFARDEDASIRRFSRFVSVAPDEVQGGGYAPSWARRVADVYCEPQCHSETADEVYISYAGAAPKLYRVSDLFRYAGPKQGYRPKDTAWPQLKANLLGKIVLIGGTFHESGDFYRTPKGELAGLVVNAYAVKAELNGSGLEAVSQPLAWILDLVVALLIIAVCDEQVLKGLNRYPFPSLLREPIAKKFLFGTLIVFAFCWGSIKLAHGRYLLGFAGEGLGVLIDRVRDLWESREEYKEEAEQLKSEAKAV